MICSKCKVRYESGAMDYWSCKLGICSNCSTKKMKKFMNSQDKKIKEGTKNGH